ncbi:hypothetical protein ABW20_dc0105179 [Dactylellina cionopaga]|nr:hypothetical protein ABW20_dc0105179 [Dactylellina cionopaga]
MQDDPWPASVDNLPNLITVGGIDKAGFRTSSAKNVWVYAPAEQIFVPVGGSEGKQDAYSMKEGTPFASAAVAGILAGYISKYPKLSSLDAIGLLKNNTYIRGEKNGAPVAWNGEKKRKISGSNSSNSNSIKSITFSTHTVSSLTSEKFGRGGPKPGYVTRTIPIEKVDVNPGRVTTVTEDFPTIARITVTADFSSMVPTTVTASFSSMRSATVTKFQKGVQTSIVTTTRISVMPVKALETVATTQIETMARFFKPPDPWSPYTKTCYGLERGAYFQRDDVLQYIKDHFCQDLQNNVPDTQDNCTDWSYWKTKEYWNKQENWNSDIAKKTNCAWVYPAFQGLLGEVQVGVRWDRPGLRPTKSSCIRIFRDILIEGCDNDVIANPLNYKGGGTVDHGPEVHYWLDPQREPGRLRLPHPPKTKELSCTLEEYGIWAHLYKWHCETLGWGETDKGGAELKRLLISGHKCLSVQAHQDKYRWELAGTPAQPYEFWAELIGDQIKPQVKCVADSFRGAAEADQIPLNITLLYK